MLVTCHLRGDSLGPGSATLGGSARTPRDSTSSRLHWFLRPPTPLVSSSTGLQAPSSKLNWTPGSKLNSALSDSSTGLQAPSSTWLSPTPSTPVGVSTRPFYRHGALPLPSLRAGENSSRAWLDSVAVTPKGRGRSGLFPPKMSALPYFTFEPWLDPPLLPPSRSGGGGGGGERGRGNPRGYRDFSLRSTLLSFFCLSRLHRVGWQRCYSMGRPVWLLK